MKTLRFFYLLLCGIMLQGLTYWGYAQSPIPGYDDFPVPIDEEHFPDGAFRQFVSENYDTDGDEKLSFTEAERVQNLSLSSMGIESLESIKYFFSLGYLDCSSNQLTALDVSGCTALETLFCAGNQLTSLDLSANAKLIGFDASDNSLEVVLDGNDAFDLSSLPNFDIDRASDWNGAVLDGNMLTFTQQEATYQYATAYAGESGAESLKSVLFTLVADRDPSVGNEAIEDQPQGRVYAKDRTIFTEGISGEVSVYAIVGTLVYQGQSNRIPVRQAGIYIVRNNGDTWKLLVR